MLTRKGAGQTDIERRLRAERPQAPQELLAAVVARIRERPARRTVVRLGLALFTVGAVAVVFASLGGAGYASSAARQVVRKLQTVVQSQPSTRAAVPMSPSQAQYGPVPVPPYPPPRPTTSPEHLHRRPPTPLAAPVGRRRNSGRKWHGRPGQRTGAADRAADRAAPARRRRAASRVRATARRRTATGAELPVTGLSLLLPAGLAILLVGGGSSSGAAAATFPTNQASRTSNEPPTIHHW